MHMSDALVSPTVGGVMWIASATLLAMAAHKVRKDAGTRLAPLMGVLAAFVFAIQMVNFAIPGTGASGHLSGGILLAAFLGPYAGLIAMASVLVVQALFFADGGLLALGCNIFNMGVVACMVIYPLVFKPLLNGRYTPRRLMIVSVVSSLLVLELGASMVVFETWASGVSALPLSTFFWLMLPIHLAIGLVEGLATGAILAFVAQTQPQIFSYGNSLVQSKGGWRRFLMWVGISAVLVGGFISWIASENPDGLEWSLDRSAFLSDQRGSSDSVHKFAEDVQQKVSVLPDYQFANHSESSHALEPEKEVDLSQRGATSLAGLLGGSIIFLSMLFGAYLFSHKSQSVFKKNE